MFGPEYVDAEAVDFGAFEISGDQQTKSVDICDSQHNSTLILPPGGYIIKYISGAFLLLNGEPAVFVVGGKRGMQVEWKSSTGRNWTSVGYPIEDEAVSAEAFKSINMANLTNVFYIELTTPHRLRLTSPGGSVGRVRTRVWRHIPSVLLDQKEQQ